MKDPKTTIAGLIGGLAMIAVTFGMDISPEFQTSLAAVVIGVVSWFAKDKK